MWSRPRETIQSIVSRDPTHLVVPLAALSGISEALDKASTKSLGDSMELPAIFALAIVAGAISGVVGLYILCYLLKLSGRWLGGKSSSVNIRAATAWSSVPIIWALLLWVPELLIFGKDLFTTAAPSITARPAVYFGFLGVELAIAIWGVVVFCKALGQVQAFSAWRALGSAVLAFFIVALPILLLGFLVSGIG
ncbi:YIP1 family protein [Luteimonas sp. A537]